MPSQIYPLNHNEAAAVQGIRNAAWVVKLSLRPGMTADEVIAARERLCEALLSFEINGPAFAIARDCCREVCRR